jgi:putative protease
VQFGNGAVNLDRIRPGDLLWRSHDPELDKVVKPLTQAAAPVHKQPLQVRVSAQEGAPLVAVWSLVDHPQVAVTVTSPEALAAAQNCALDAAALRSQFERLGNTPYVLVDLQVEVQGRPFAPASLLNNLRRQAVDALADLQGRPRAVALYDPLAALDAAWSVAATYPEPHPEPPAVPQLHLLVRTPQQLDAALDLRPATITLDYLDLYGLRPAVDAVRAAGIPPRVASPRILKPDEQRMVGFLLRLDCAILVRSAGLLHVLAGQDHPPLIGDFSLNAANALTAAHFLQLGLARLAPTHDLNAAQVTALAQAIGPH